MSTSNVDNEKPGFKQGGTMSAAVRRVFRSFTEQEDDEQGRQYLMILIEKCTKLAVISVYIICDIEVERM